MEIEAISLTAKKKIDWKALSKPDKINALNNVRVVLPENETESQLACIWESVMKISGLSVVESFFNVGGHSLHIPEIVARIEAQFGKKITIRDFMLHSTLRDLANLLINKKE